MNCPKCGAPLGEGCTSIFLCGSFDGSLFRESVECLRRQLAQRTADRDALAARVKELEPYKATFDDPDALHLHMLRTMTRGQQLHVLGDAWTARVNELEEAGDSVLHVLRSPQPMATDKMEVYMRWTRAKGQR